MSEEQTQTNSFAATKIWKASVDEFAESLEEIESFAPLRAAVLLNFDLPDQIREQNIVGAILAQHNPNLFV